MRWQGVLAAVAGAVCGVSSLAVTGAAIAQAAPAAPVASGAGTAASPWGKAIAIPGLAALNQPGEAVADSMACISAGHCVAAGTFADVPAGAQGFVVTENKGHWGKAIEIPGLKALKAEGVGDISVSCGKDGNCSVGGDYAGPGGHGVAFVASEKNGKWGRAIAVPGLNALDTGKSEDLTSLSCSSGSNCTAGGTYQVGSGSSRGFLAYVVSERNGHWGKAMRVPGLDPSQFARIKSLACASTGNCSAGGTFGGSDGFVVSEKNGKWGKAIVVPGLDALNTGQEGEVDQISCGGPGDCSAGGLYTDSDGNEQAFVVSEKNGAWGNAIDVPGLKALNLAGISEVHSVACTGPGDCTVGGTYKHSLSNDFQGYVVSEKNGKWGNATEIPNLGTLNRGGDVQLVRVACVSPGNCVAGGNYAISKKEGADPKPFVASESKGVWGKAEPVPGLNALNFGQSSVVSIACPSSGPCVAGGFYEDRSGNHLEGFVVSQK